MGLFDRATVKAHGVTVNVEVNADAKPVTSPVPVLVLLPFDVEAYNREAVTEQAAKYPRYNAKKGCAKCGAPGAGWPHKSVYRTDYTVYPHPTEIKNGDLKYEHRKAVDEHWYMGRYESYYPSVRILTGPGYIARQCVRCNYEWNELACDEKAV